MIPVLRNGSPFAAMTPVPFSRLDGFFDRVLGEEAASSPSWSGSAPIALWQDEDQFFVEADVPGMAEADVDVTIHRNILTIRGERKPAEGRSYLYDGRALGRFERTITLPEAIRVDEIRAELKDGVLRLTLPKSPESKPRKISFQAS